MLRCMNCVYHLSQLWAGVSIPKCERELQEFLFLNEIITGVFTRELWEFTLIMTEVSFVSVSFTPDS